MSLNGHYDPDNIFAKILRGDIPCARVYEDDHVLAFMDAFPQSKGHTLVIPKTPGRNIFDATPSDLVYLVEKTQFISEAVCRALSPDGIIITQFNGAAAGQTVFHLHFHIIPRYSEHSMGRHGSGEMAEFSKLQELAGLITAAIT